MMPPIILQVLLFRDDQDLVRSRVAMLHWLDALVAHDRLWLRFHPETPGIYESGVRYAYKDRVEAAAWQDIPTCIGKGYGDCKDFAAWRVAELMEREGRKARPIVQWRKIDGSWRFHALVGFPDGTMEDPSRKLGMGSISGSTGDDQTVVTGIGEKMPVTPKSVASGILKGLVSTDPEEQEKARRQADKLNKLASDGVAGAIQARKILNFGAAKARQAMRSKVGKLALIATGPVGISILAANAARNKIDQIRRKAAKGDKKAIALNKEIQKQQAEAAKHGGVPPAAVDDAIDKLAPQAQASDDGAPPSAPRDAEDFDADNAEGQEEYDDEMRGDLLPARNVGFPEIAADLHASINGHLPDHERRRIENDVIIGFDFFKKLQSVVATVAPQAAPFLASAASAIPFVGPVVGPLTADAVKHAGNMLDKAKKGSPQAKQAIQDIKNKAGQGDQQAQQALETLQRVQAANKATEATMAKMQAIAETQKPKPVGWSPRSLYRLGVSGLASADKIHASGF